MSGFLNAMQDLLMRLLDDLDQWLTLQQTIAHRVTDHAAGDFTTLMTTYTISDHANTMFRYHDNCVFVVPAGFAGVGLCCYVPQLNSELVCLVLAAYYTGTGTLAYTALGC